ncbi:DUF6504 family protein [Deinococcus peraridilitoris]|uniref:DUF6504 domain-containing protein n=1 Tax=Deinococcus peraridilitoris (strain DSM 19664 / LMG 22246 / CIP 109416 / KR-200) TaxID=937777 RepID=L0A4S0_DEIPD|nr:DUF6504 family protein [Deinococcus peraridilitoris]AFZ68434.1 hypothetical protein Deipe_2982 [Deinococcus peraridilitoris DSM 19664]
MRAFLEPVTVELSPSGVPLRLNWQGRTLRVLEVRDVWEAGGLWWQGQPNREYWWLVTGRNEIEVFHELGGEGRWVLSRCAD